MPEIDGQKIVGLLKKGRHIDLTSTEIIKNGEFYPPEGYAFSKVKVKVPYENGTEIVVLKLQDKTITTNGSVVPDDGFDGLNKVTVKVPTYITGTSYDALPETADEGVIAVITEGELNGIISSEYFKASGTISITCPEELPAEWGVTGGYTKLYDTQRDIQVGDFIYQKYSTANSRGQNTIVYVITIIGSSTSSFIQATSKPLYFSDPYLQHVNVSKNIEVTPYADYYGLSKVTVNVPTYITVASENKLPESAADGTIAVISNSQYADNNKPVYVKEDDMWMKKDAYMMKNAEWIKISSITDMVSYVGSSTREVVSDDLFAELQVVNKDNLYGTTGFTTTQTGWLWWITPSAISSITVPPFPVPHTEMNSAYVYNGVSYHCYKSDYEIVPDYHEFLIA